MELDDTLDVIGGTDTKAKNEAARIQAGREEANFLSRVRTRRGMTLAETGERIALCRPPAGFRTIRVMRNEGVDETEYARLRLEHSGEITDYRIAPDVDPATVITGWWSCGSTPFVRPGVLDVFVRTD